MEVTLASEEDVNKLVTNILNSNTKVASHDESEDVTLVQDAMKIVRQLLSREADDGEEDSIWEISDLVEALQALQRVSNNEKLDVILEDMNNSNSPLASEEVLTESTTTGSDDMALSEEAKAEVGEAVAAANAPILEAITAQTAMLASLVQVLTAPAVVAAEVEAEDETTEEAEAGKVPPQFQKDKGVDDPDADDNTPAGKGAPAAKKVPPQLQKDKGVDDPDADDNTPPAKKGAPAMKAKAGDETEEEVVEAVAEEVVASEDEDDDGEERVMTQSVNASYEEENQEPEETESARLEGIVNAAREAASSTGLGVHSTGHKDLLASKQEYIRSVARQNRIPVGVVEQPGQITRETPINVGVLTQLFRRN